MKSFEYHRPSTVKDAVDLLVRHGSGAKVLAGGTDLAIDIKEGAVPDAVIDIKGIEPLCRLGFDGTNLYVGARVTFTELLESSAVREHFPLLAETAGSVASPGLRNRATMVGNICSAVPCLDSGPFLLLYEAAVQVEGPEGQRETGISSWFKGPRRTALEPGEMVVGVRIPLPQVIHGGCYVKMKRVTGEDLAQSGVGVLALEGHEYRVAFTAVGPVPTRGAKIEALLNGKELSEELVARAKELVPEEIRPIADVRSSREYRMHMTKVMLDRALRAAVARRDGGWPEYGTPLL